MPENTVKISKNICTFCQTPIKNEEEEFLCPSCSSPYHRDCWAENKGCAVYGCGEKLRERSDEDKFREAIINIEYLINRNQFSEAIFEAKQYLKIDRRNPEFKNLYNKAVALINNKMNLMTSGDEAFGKKDYKSAQIYYKNVLKYTDEVETNFINTRLEICKEKIPEQDRRRIYQNILIIVIILAILTAIGYLGYYTLVLKEDRDFTEIVKSDNASDLSSMEKMIGKYENFLRTYSNSRNKNKAMDKILRYSYRIANEYYKDDWKLALKYYSKISNSIGQEEAKQLKNKIYNKAYKEFTEKNANAKKLNASAKYGEALNELSSALQIISSFPDSEINKETEVLEANIQLLNKKLSSVLKANDIEREIREKDKQLNSLTSSGNKETVIINARITKDNGSGTYTAKENSTGNNVVIKSISKAYSVGDVIIADCIINGKMSIDGENGKKVNVQIYEPVFDMNSNDPSEITISEKEAITERLKNLRIQKEKIDSLMKMSLL